MYVEVIYTIHIISYLLYRKHLLPRLSHRNFDVTNENCEVMEKKRTVKQYIDLVRRKKDIRLAVIYSVSYFVYITALLVIGTIKGSG